MRTRFFKIYPKKQPLHYLRPRRFPRDKIFLKSLTLAGAEMKKGGLRSYYFMCIAASMICCTVVCTRVAWMSWDDQKIIRNDL